MSSLFLSAWPESGPTDQESAPPSGQAGATHSLCLLVPRERGASRNRVDVAKNDLLI